MKYTYDEIVWHIAPTARPCPSCNTLVHTLSAWDEDLGPLCPACHPGWAYATFEGQRPQDQATAEWQAKIKDRRARLAAERKQTEQEERDSH